MNISDLEMICTSKYIDCSEENGYCSRFDSMIPPKEFFISEEEAAFQQEAEELSQALERYKLISRRSCFSFEELIHLLKLLGYRKDF